jgi:predicted RNase H-like HicB family nuclease
MHYVVVIEKTGTGYSAYVPDLPGCISVGETREEIEINIQEAIIFHLEGMNEDGLEIPTPETAAITMVIPKVAYK